MEEKKKMNKKDIYALVFIGLFYLYLYGKYVISAALSITVWWEWILFIVLLLIALFVCGSGWLFSYGIVIKAIEYFGLPKSYFVLTILSIIIAPLTIIILFLVLSGTIPSILNPEFL